MPLQGVAYGEVQPCRCLVIVLRQRLLGRAQVQRLTGSGLVALRGVEILLVIEDLEAHIDWAIANIRLGEAKQELAASTAQVGLHAERFAETQEVVGLIIDAEK